MPKVKGRIASFDIGVRNLAMCLVDCGEKVEIVEWRVFDITTEQQEEPKKCERQMKSGKDCVRISCKVEDNLAVCRIHCKVKPIKKKLKKVKAFSTQDLVVKLIQTMNKYIEENPTFLEDTSEIIIELQPKINPKMKLLSHALYTYFISKGVISGKVKTVKFIAAKNKLKVAQNLYKGEQLTCKLKGAYAQRKYFAKEYTKWIIANNDYPLIWKETLENHKAKQDDLCDCFLQALWYSYV